MKKILPFFLFTALAFPVMSQSPLDEDGNQFNLSSGYSTTGIPVFISYEMGIHEDMTLGLEASFRAYREPTDSMDYQHSIYGISFFGNYYFNTLFNIDDKWGPYAGLNVGYFKWISPEGYLEKGESSGSLSAGAQIGCRYFIKNFGLFLEGNAGIQLIGGRFGISYKFY